MNLDDLNKVARAMVAPGKGILAADESSGTIKKRFDAIGVESTEDTRRDYREMMFRTAEAMKNHISGVILYDETIWQNAKDGTPLVKVIEQMGAIPGIKVDEGTKPLPFAPNELITVGLDKLADRLAKYYAQGARFAKWRAVIDIGAGIPTANCIKANAHALARYAALCQQAQIVPIVEPEVLMDGDHDIDRCFNVSERVLHAVFNELFEAHVQLEGIVLKPNMVVPGKKSAKKASVQEVAEKTVTLLKLCVPAAVPGIAFLSGGQSDEEATAHLDSMNKIGNLPWALTFSYGRALQAAPQKAWSGKAENVAAGQRAFAHRAKMNSLAALGQWKADLEKNAAYSSRCAQRTSTCALPVWERALRESPQGLMGEGDCPLHPSIFGWTLRLPSPTAEEGAIARAAGPAAKLGNKRSDGSARIEPMPARASAPRLAPDALSR
jgi:fructose-bisphosphate aldolase class I